MYIHVYFIIHTRTHSRIRAYMPSCTYMNACAHAYTHARTHARTHAHTHARTHARTHTHTPTQVLDYLSDFICVLYGKPGGYGVVTMPFSVREGINIFLAGFIPTENLRFREIELSFKISENPEDLAGIHSHGSDASMCASRTTCLSACDFLACGIRADEFRSRVSWYRILACGMRAHAPTTRASSRLAFIDPAELTKSCC